jgi:hypothetical protein
MVGRLGGRFRVAEWKEDYMGNDFRVRGQREERVLLSEVGRRERCKDENGGRWVVGVDVTEAPLLALKYDGFGHGNRKEG